jgi:hypothetical protein
MIKQCSNCKYAYEECHMRAKEIGDTLACNFWKPQDEPRKDYKKKPEKKYKSWWEF